MYGVGHGSECACVNRPTGADDCASDACRPRVLCMWWHGCKLGTGLRAQQVHALSTSAHAALIVPCEGRAREAMLAHATALHKELA